MKMTKSKPKPPQMCVDCTEPTKTRIETLGPDTNMELVVTYVCEVEDCDYKRADKLVAEIKKEAEKPREKKNENKKSQKGKQEGKNPTGKKATKKSNGGTKNAK